MSTLRLHALTTGFVRIRPSAARARRRGFARTLDVLSDRAWTDWLPIHAWAIEHPGGVIVVDAGERASTPNLAFAEFRVRPEDELRPQLERLGIAPKDLRCVVQTHLHGDHVGGLHGLPGTPVLASETELAGQRGLAGWFSRNVARVHLPQGFAGRPVAFAPQPYGPFGEHHDLTGDGRVIVVPTPGHTGGHVSVLVVEDGLTYFLAGDTSYSEAGLLERAPSGFSASDALEVATHERILGLARQRPVVYLPSHDPASAARLASRQTLMV